MLCCVGLRFLAWQLPTECKLESRDAYVLIPPRVANHPTPIFPTALCRGRGQRRGGRGPGQRGRLASRQRRHLPHPGAQQHVSTRLAWRRCASAVCASAVSARSQKWCTAVAAAYAAYAATCPAALPALCADSHTSCCFFFKTNLLPPSMQSAQVLPPEEVVDDLFSPTKRHEARYLWKTQRERSAWLVSVHHVHACRQWVWTRSCDVRSAGCCCAVVCNASVLHAWPVLHEICPALASQTHPLILLTYRPTCARQPRQPASPTAPLCWSSRPSPCLLPWPRQAPRARAARRAARQWLARQAVLAAARRQLLRDRGLCRVPVPRPIWRQRQRRRGAAARAAARRRLQRAGSGGHRRCRTTCDRRGRVTEAVVT